MKTTLLLLAVCAALLSGCVTASALRSADYGPMPKQEDAKKQAITYLESILKDPDSARYQFVSLRKGWLKDGGISGKLHAGWMLDVQVNAKNSFGGYTGWETYRLLFVNGRLYNAIPWMFFDAGNAGELD